MIKVTISNKLGGMYGYRSLHVKEDGKDCTGSPVPYRGSVSVPTLSATGELEKLELRVDESAGGLGPASYPPPNIQAPPGVAVSIKPTGWGKKWKLTFKSPSTASTADQMDIEAVAAKPPPENHNVNVTVGQDEPPMAPLMLVGASAGAAGFGLGILLGPCLQGMSSILWGGLVAVSFIGSLVTGIIAWKKKNPTPEPVETTENLEE